MLEVSILGTARHVPARQVTSEDIRALAGLDWTPEEVERRTGIRTRYWIGDRTMASLAAETARMALDRAGLAPADLARLIFVNSTGGDVLFPATCNAVLADLGLAHTCDAFDLNNACLGFLTAFDLAARSIATGLGPIAIVTVENPSRFIVPEYRRSFLIFGDAAAAAVLGPGGSGRVLASSFGNDGSQRDAVVLAHPGLTGRPEHITFHDSNQAISDAAVEAVARCSSKALDQAGLGLGDVDWFVTHQPNGLMLREIVRRLGLPDDRTVSVVEEIGSVGAVSLPYALDVLVRTRPVRPGQRLLMAGVGAGAAYGAIVYEL